MERCIRCDGELEKGFVIDKGDYDLASQATWASGDPNTSFWSTSVVKSGSKKIPVVTYRCQNCGRLEPYAHDVS